MLADTAVPLVLNPVTLSIKLNVTDLQQTEISAELPIKKSTAVNDQKGT